MASTFSNLKFEIIGNGEQSGTWGTTTNTNIGTAIEQAIVGMATLEAADFTANVATLTLANTNAAQDARALCLNIASGAVSAAGTVNVPAIEKPYIIINGSSFTVTVKVSGQTGVAVPAGKRTVVYNNGTDVGSQINWLAALEAATLTTSGTVTLNGGTANGVAFLNGSKVLTTGSALTFDGAILGVNGVSVGRGAGAVASNTAVGASALAANTVGIQSTGIGANALQYQTNNNNTALGYNAMLGVSGVSTGGSNTAVGSNSLAGLTTGNFNTAIGQQSLLSNTTASNNTAVGYQAGYTNTTGTVNTAVGYQALYANTTGSDNVAVGSSALVANTTASNSTAIGWRAGFSNQTGASNTFVGKDAGYSTTGGFNTFVGSGVSGGAGESITSGTKNTILGGYNGNQGGLDIRTSSNNIVLSDGDGNPRLLINGTAQVRPTFDNNFRYAEQSIGWGNVSSTSQNLESLFPNLPTGVNSCYLIQVVTGSSGGNGSSCFIVANKTGTSTWSFDTTNLGAVATTPSGSGATLTLSFSSGAQYGYAMIRALVIT